MAASAHGPDCECARCVGFRPGNGVAVRHGAYASPVRLAPRAQEIADAIRPYLPVGGEAFESTLGSYALTLARVERAAAALDDVEGDLDGRGARPAAQYAGNGEVLERLRKDLRLWLMAALRFQEALGLTPRAAASILRDAGVGKAASAQAALREHIEREYGRGADE